MEESPLDLPGRPASLLTYVRDRIHNGELTERRLARMIGMSQPHMHNVLKGARNLSLRVFGFDIKIFHMSILDLDSPRS